MPRTCIATKYAVLEEGPDAAQAAQEAVSRLNSAIQGSVAVPEDATWDDLTVLGW